MPCGDTISGPELLDYAGGGLHHSVHDGVEAIKVGGVDELGLRAWGGGWKGSFVGFAGTESPSLVLAWRGLTFGDRESLRAYDVVPRKVGIPSQSEVRFHRILYVLVGREKAFDENCEGAEIISIGEGLKSHSAA